VFGNLRVTSLLFADDVALLASSSHDLQLNWSGLQLSVKQLGQIRGYDSSMVQ